MSQVKQTFLPKQENFERTYVGLKAHLCTIVRSQIKITTNRQGELCHFILRSNLKFTKIGQKELLTIPNSLYKIVNVDGECQRTLGRERERPYDSLSKEDLSGFGAHLYTYKKWLCFAQVFD